MNTASAVLRTMALAAGLTAFLAMGVAQTVFIPSGTSGIGSSANSNVGIGTSSPSALLDIRAGSVTTLYAATGGAGSWAGDFHNLDGGGDRYVSLAGGTHAAVFMNGNVGIGTTAPSSLLQVAGPITAGSAGGSTSGIDYLYGHYGSGKLFVLGSQYSSAASFIGYAVKAKQGAVGYVSSTDVTVGRSAIEANMGYIAFLTGGSQGSSDGGAVSIAERMRIESSGNVGIGTTSPLHRLSVIGQPDATALFNVGKEGDYYGSWMGGSQGNDPHVWVGDWYSAGGGLTWNSSESVLLLDTYASSQNLLIANTGGNVGIGTRNPSHKLAVNGTVRAKEVIVDTGWADYVFTEGYRLAPLAEVEQHIREKKHLPGIPSADEVERGGVSVGDMQARLLAKIEELTLHLIAQQKEIEALKLEIKGGSPKENHEK